MIDVTFYAPQTAVATLLQKSEQIMPKVFISYSWTSHGHQETVKQWAERLLADGVEVVLDIFDLKEGHDSMRLWSKWSQTQLSLTYW